MSKNLLLILLSVILFGCEIKNQSLKENPTSHSTLDSNFVSNRRLQIEENTISKLKSENEWDSLLNYSKIEIKHKKGKLNSNFRTFGWHLFSQGSAYQNYNYSLLWGLSYFSYSINPINGSYKTIYDWKTSPVIDSAKANNCKVFLSVSNFGKHNNNIFLTNKSAQKTLFDSLKSLLRLKDADGINIDFEGVAKENSEDYMDFLKDISINLKKENPNYMVSACLYTIDWHKIFNIRKIDKYIDFYTLMGYDYYGSFSKIAGPVTPLKNSDLFGKGLESSVNHYKSQDINLEKLIVGLPYYGAEWQTQDTLIGSKVVKFEGHPPYRNIKSLYLDSLELQPKFDSISKSTYLSFSDSSDNAKQIFFESEESLQIKFDWIKQEKIGGVGFWALGYDNGYNNLWNLIHKNFSQK
jgi:spore germination protein YaaH